MSVCQRHFPNLTNIFISTLPPNVMRGPVHPAAECNERAYPHLAAECHEGAYPHPAAELPSAVRKKISAVVHCGLHNSGYL